MDIKSKKDHKAETKKVREKQGKELESMSQNVSDQKVLKVAENSLKGGTVEGRQAVKGHLKEGSGMISAEFKKNDEQIHRTIEETGKSIEDNKAHRDANYEDAKSLGKAASEIRHKETKREISSARDESARDALFFDEQRKEREQIQKTGKRLRQGLESTFRSLSREGLESVIGGLDRGGQAIPPHKDNQHGVGYIEEFDSSKLGRSQNDVINRPRNDRKAKQRGDPEHYDVIERTSEGDNLHHRVYKP